MGIKRQGKIQRQS